MPRLALHFWSPGPSLSRVAGARENWLCHIKIKHCSGLKTEVKTCRSGYRNEGAGHLAVVLVFNKDKTEQIGFQGVPSAFSLWPEPLNPACTISGFGHQAPFRGNPKTGPLGQVSLLAPVCACRGKLIPAKRICCVRAKVICNGEIISPAKTRQRVLRLRTHIVCPGAGHVKNRNWRN
jgi:hypothetical protein